MLQNDVLERYANELALYFYRHPAVGITDLAWRIDSVTGCRFEPGIIEVLEHLVAGQLKALKALDVMLADEHAPVIDIRLWATGNDEE